VYYTNFPVLDYPHRDANEDDLRRQGLSLIKAIDDAVGGVVQKLRDLGLEENTLILFASDNGAPLGATSWNGSENVPMRGNKGLLWEGGVRVPMFAYWKGTIPPGQVIDEMITTLDFTATTLAAGGGTVPPEFDGADILPRLLDTNEAINRTKPMFWDFLGQRAIRKGDWKLRRSAAGDYLFNIADDPHELFNLALKEPAKAAEMGTELTAWFNTLPANGQSTLSTVGEGTTVTGAIPGTLPDDRYLTPYVDAAASAYPAPITMMGMDFENFELLSEAWLSDDTPTANWNQYYDLDDSGAIGIGDLEIFTDIWLLGN
jgi:hypothetical protein